MLLGQEIWTLLVAILTGGFTLAGVYITYYFQNKPSVIMEKTKAMAKQQIKIEMTMAVINGAEELKLTIDELNSSMLDIASDMLNQIQEQNYLQAKEIIRTASIKFYKDSRVYSDRIANFVFLVIKDGMFNRENDKEDKEHEEILIKIKEIQDIHTEMMKDMDKLENIKINNENIESIGEEFKKRMNEMSAITNNFVIWLLSKYEIRFKNI